MEPTTAPKPDDAMPWLDAVRRRVARWRVPGETWVIAVSGGSDSVGLLRALQAIGPQLELSLVVAHLDHGVRGEAARADARFVEQLAASLGSPFELGQWSPSRESHFEADARRARHSWLVEVAIRHGATGVAMGHTRDDQAETILQRIVRGTGLRGLSGIPARRVLSANPPIRLVRPLLGISRQAIRESLQAIGQDYREDASNTDLSYTRARIRHDLLLRLARDYNPRAAEAIVRLGRLASASERAIEQRLIELEHGIVGKATTARIELRSDRLKALPSSYLQVELLRRAWRSASWPEAELSAKQWRRLAATIGNSRIRRASFPGGIEFLAARSDSDPSGMVVLERSQPSDLSDETTPQTALLEIPGQAAWPGGTVAAILEPSGPCDETIDLDQVVLPLQLRGPRDGDRFSPLGMNGRSTPLNDFFRSRDVPRGRRASTPLLCDAEGIIWVVGHRIADRVKLSATTQRRLGLRWTPEAK